MVFENMVCHGFEELVKVEGKEGDLLQRIPVAVKETLSERGQQMAIMPAGNEIRFIPLEDTVYEIGPDPIAINISIPDRIKKYIACNGAFSYHPSLVRIILRRGNVHVINVTGKRRVPNEDELPKKTLLSYGTSITHGAGASMPTIAFAKLTARKLHMDHINLGFGGSAFCEQSIADHIAGRNDWDTLTLCISVNMLNMGYSLDEYHKRAQYMIQRIGEKHPDKQIVCISPLRYYADADHTINQENRLSTGKEYRQALKNIVEKMNSSKIIYAEGLELLDAFGGLTSDLLHPGDYGMISIAENLAKIIKENGL